MNEKFKQSYNALYFLSALGNGGLAVSFFMYLMFMVKHADTPIPTFNHIYKAIIGGNGLSRTLLSVALLGIIYFSYRHYKMLYWNVGAYKQFKQTDEFTRLKSSNGEVTLMALPLTYAMSVNVIFILGAIFIPGLWNYVEYLFPFSLAAFAGIGIYGLKIFSEYFSRLIIKGDFDFINNNNLSQLISSFAFTMIGVGFAAAGAMSENITTSVVGILGAVFFTIVSVLLLVVKLVLGFKSIFKHGIAKESAPSLWIVIPIMTLLGITFVRVTSGVFHNLLHTNPSPVIMFVGLSIFLSIQGIIGFIGYSVLKKTNYFGEYVNGNKSSVGSFALICPGVATFVLGMFFIHWGLVKTNIVGLFSPTYFVVIAPFVIIQLKTILVLFKLNKKLIREGKTSVTIHEEKIKGAKTKRNVA